MMFNLVVAIFVLVNGEPSGQPVQMFAYNQTFESEEACMAFSSSDEGMVLRYSLNEFIMSKRGAIMARLGCAKAEDNTI